MSRTKVELNRQGVRELLLSSEIGAICREQASAVASRHGDAEVGGVFRGKNRVNVAVTAPRDNDANNLLRALK